MDTKQYLETRRKLKCKTKKRSGYNRELHQKLGPILYQEETVERLMEVDKPEPVLPPSQEMGFIF